MDVVFFLFGCMGFLAADKAIGLHFLPKGRSGRNCKKLRKAKKKIGPESNPDLRVALEKRAGRPPTQHETFPYSDLRIFAGASLNKAGDAPSEAGRKYLSEAG
jgi:hypothetical protein